MQKNVSSTSSLSLKLDPDPTGEEELRAIASGNEAIASGAAHYDEEAAKIRLDKVAHRLAIAWSVFLVCIIMMQGLKKGLSVPLPMTVLGGDTLWILPHFDLESTEFIAVVTTTTATVFGFLTIVAGYLFKKQGPA